MEVWNVIDTLKLFFQEPPTQKPLKKLRLVKKPTQASAAVYVGLLENAKTSNDAMQLLLRISDSLHFKVCKINLFFGPPEYLPHCFRIRLLQPYLLMLE